MQELIIAAIPHPDPLPVPAPPGLIWFLLILTFVLHLLPMNFVLGGSIMALLSHIKGAGHDGHRSLSRFFGKAMPAMVAATITMGVAPLLLTQVLYGRLFFSSSILMAWFWAAVIPLLITGYFATYRIAFGHGADGKRVWLAPWLAALAFVAIGIIYTGNMTLMLRAGELTTLYAENPAGSFFNTGDASMLPRFLHMLFGSLAVAGMVAAFYGLHHRKTDERLSGWAVRYGSLWFVIATGINIVIGFWWLMTVPRETMLLFMGGNMAATAALSIGILTGLVALMLMAMALNARAPLGLVMGAASSLLVSVVAMVLCRDHVRKGALAAAGFQPNNWVETQWSPLLLFIVLLLAAFATVYWMLVRLARNG